MFDLIIRNIMNRKIRSALTICGIALGIFAVIVMGAMSENFHQTFERSISVTSDKIRVFAESGVFGGGLTNDKVSDVLRVAGVKDAYGLLMTTFDEDKMGMTGKQILGVPPEKSSVALYPVELKSGRFLNPGDSYQVVVGSNIKREYQLQTGSKFKIHEKYFTVVGILDYTGSIFDNAVIIPLKTAQDLYNVGNSVSYIFAVPDERADTEKLSKRIELSVKGTSTLSPGELEGAGKAVIYDIQCNNYKLRASCSDNRRTLRNEYHAYVRCRKNQRVRDFKSHWSRNSGYLAPDARRSLMYGLFRRNPWNPGRSRGCLCHECLACKYKDCPVPDNSQTPYNCDAFCLTDRCSLRTLPRIQSLEDEPYGGFEACLK